MICCSVVKIDYSSVVFGIRLSKHITPPLSHCDVIFCGNVGMTSLAGSSLKYSLGTMGGRCMLLIQAGGFQEFKVCVYYTLGVKV